MVSWKPFSKLKKMIHKTETLKLEQDKTCGFDIVFRL